jgi:hypothetical protein
LLSLAEHVSSTDRASAADTRVRLRIVALGSMIGTTMATITAAAAYNARETRADQLG